MRTDAHTDIFTRPLNEFAFDQSETDSFQTCASTINSSQSSKHQQKSDYFEILPSGLVEDDDEDEDDDEENIFLIRESQRGVSLPVTMKLDYDDMALRLPASSSMEAPHYSTRQTDPGLETARLPTASSSRASTPSLSSTENEQHKLPSSWLNTVNTITTMIEGPDGRE